jgi:hypothetical protein
MCVYCMIADWARQYSPPPPNWVQPFVLYTPPLPQFYPVPNQYPPNPASQPSPWSRDQLDGLADILKRVKALEDTVGGCPCEEPEKLDYLGSIREQLDRIEQKVDGPAKPPD